MMKIALTGGSGRIGNSVLKELLDHGYDVTVIDAKRPNNSLQPWWKTFRQCDMTDYGQTFAALHGHDVIVHLAADPRPDFNHFAGAQRFHNNTLSVYNVFNASVELGVQRVVWASSETIYGFPFDEVEPFYVPIDETHSPLPQSSYALSKLTGELLAQQFSRWSNIPFIGLQISNVVYESVYAQCPSFWVDPTLRIFDLWSYVDHRDVAQAVHKSVRADVSGAENFIIAADDTIMNRPSVDLMAEYFPNVSVSEGHGTYQSLMCNQKAKNLLSFDPQYSWRDHISETGELIK